MTTDLATILAGFGDVFTFYNIGFVILGVTVGILVGAIPGLNGPMAIAIAVPISFYLTPLAGIAFLIGINKGSTVGGAIPAVLLNTPGTPEAAVTAMDGHPLAKKGKPLKAMKMALYSSVTGDTFSDIVLITVAAPLAYVALQLGPTEMVAVVFFSLTIITGVVGDSMLKGMIAAFFGILLATVGDEAESGTTRLTFGILELEDGIPIIAVGMGVLVMGEVLVGMERARGTGETALPLDPSGDPSNRRVSFAEYVSCRRTLARSAFIGTAIGAIPGIGSSVASLIGYTAAKRASKEPEEFGKGRLEGIAAAEAANSAVVGANLIPLLTLGIPGNVAAAFLIGAFIVHDVQPGPLVFEEQGRLIYGIFGAMIVANLSNLVIGNIGLRLFTLTARVPKNVVYPVVVLLSMSGAYLGGDGMFTVLLMLIFGVLGYLMRKLAFPVLAFIIAFVLGRIFELPLRQTLILSDGDPAFLLDRPIAIGFIVLGLIVIWRFGFIKKKQTA
ncbi:MAG: Tricarboxylate transporter family protein [Rhodospirillaceae bacterium]|nr:tripartite tricarboxylate transporter permease [Rhodospirillaceae bacterium]MXY40842.1 Tricarboxylate transporter family protein [Rhodospirillaceae bacterium]MYH36341.1 Tricarboxylate transporter family protein [Rhodospirillaceae bacterium]MYK15639.1 Tricarboxylate transporter family protein [Rhodospirillaceae bacterium]MYK57344.1 Tricarboxylate transporter family protein [Rhodospirillaceae bacterium]